MPYQPTETAAIGPYTPYQLTVASSSEVACGVILDATGSAVASPGSATVTLTLVDGDIGQLFIGAILDCDTGSSFEQVSVTNFSVHAQTVTATFANSHSAGFALRLARGSWLNTVTIPQAGSTMTLSLFNGHPATAGLPREQVPTPAAPTVTGNTSSGSSFTASQTVKVSLTYLTAGGGETLPSAQATATIAGDGNVVVVTIPTLPNGVTGANVYISAASGGTTVYKATSNHAAGNITYTNFTSNTNATPPTSNTTHLPFFQWVTATGDGNWEFGAAIARGLYAIYSGTTAGWATVNAKAMMR